VKSKAETRVAKSDTAAARAGLQNKNGDPGKIRTSDKQFRKLLLYPPELRGHSFAGQAAALFYLDPRAAVSGKFASRNEELLRAMSKPLLHE
jgi:hypothetical protein